MAKQFAEIEKNKVINVIIWDNKTPISGYKNLIEIPEETGAGIGWDYIDGQFIDNRPKPPTPKTVEVVTEEII